MRPWESDDIESLKSLWGRRSVYEICDELDRCERSVVEQAYMAGLTKDDYASVVLRNDAETIHYCQLLIRDQDWSLRKIADYLCMPFMDVVVVSKNIMRDVFRSQSKRA